MLVAAIGGCSDTSNDRDGLEPVPTRTTHAATTSAEAEAIDIFDFTVLPTFTCLKDSPARSLVTVGWSVPSASEVAISLDGRLLPVGIAEQVPYQVPAGGATGIGATVVFACDAADLHTVDVEWTARGLPPVSRTVTITKEPIDG